MAGLDFCFAGEHANPSQCPSDSPLPVAPPSDVPAWLGLPYVRLTAVSRPRIPLGTFGKIGFIDRPNGRVEARARFRDWNGQIRLTQATASSRPAAEIALRSKLAEHNALQPDIPLTPDSPLPALVDYWLADLDLEGRIAPSTRFNYERDMRRLVLPAFADLTLSEIGVARCDALLKQLGRQRSYSAAKRAKTVLRLAFGLAVRHELLPRNPIDNVSRLHKPKRTPEALTPTQVNAIRAAIKAWEQKRGTSGPNPDGQLGQIVEVMLGTSARIGEVLAIRRRDLDMTVNPAMMRIAGTLVSHRGQPTVRQDHPKTDHSHRVARLPGFTAEALRRRLSVMPDRSPDVWASAAATAPHSPPPTSVASSAGSSPPPGSRASPRTCSVGRSQQ